MTLGDRVCVMRGGVLQQVASPQVLYDSPANLFVAGFIGSPAMNLVEAQLAEAANGQRNGGLVARFGPHELGVPAEVLAARPSLRDHVGERIALGIRPEDVEDAPGPDDARIAVTVDIREDMGSEVFLHFALDAPVVKAEELRELVGDEAVEAADAQTHHHGSPFIAKVARGTAAREGERAVLTLNTRLLHFFSLETGDAL
jgi:multiple sugar transport system ATP-binding protein